MTDIYFVLILSCSILLFFALSFPRHGSDMFDFLLFRADHPLASVLHWALLAFALVGLKFGLSHLG